MIFVALEIVAEIVRTEAGPDGWGRVGLRPLHHAFLGHIHRVAGQTQPDTGIETLSKET